MNAIQPVAGIRAELVRLYQEMANLTAPECGKICSVPHSCCTRDYCRSAAKYAQKYWGASFEPVNGVGVLGQVIPFLGPNGCIVPPHMRPLCTVHTCEIGSIGCKRGDEKWTKRYFELREQLDVLELELFTNVGRAAE